MPKPSKQSRSASDGPAPSSVAEEETVAGPRRRTFPVDYKRRILKEAESCHDRGGVAALLRREGLYSSHLTAWRRQFEAGGRAALKGQSPGRKAKKTAEQRRIEQLEKEKAKLERELHIAHVLLDLQKKASELLGITLPPPPESDESS